MRAGWRCFYSCSMIFPARPGQALGVLYLLGVFGCSSPAPVEDRGVATMPAAQAAGSVYIVARGDTLSSIARRHGVSLSRLQQFNALDNPDLLELGERLLIPGQTGRPARLRLEWPVARLRVSSEFGSRNGRHKGIDLAAKKKTPIRAAAGGVVEFSGKKSGYGRVIILRHDGGIRTLYAHNRKNLVNVGERVKRGQVIAKVGHSGRATGSHVHFETIVDGRPRNPRYYISNMY